MSKENLEEKVKELAELDKEIASKINDLKSLMVKNNTGGKEYIV